MHIPIKIELNRAFSHPTSGFMLKEKKTGHLRDTCTPTFMEVLYAVVKVQNQPKNSSKNRLLKQMCHVHAHTPYSEIFRQKKGGNTAIYRHSVECKRILCLCEFPISVLNKMKNNRIC